jgi:hypothetical protein
MKGENPVLSDMYSLRFKRLKGAIYEGQPHLLINCNCSLFDFLVLKRDCFCLLFFKKVAIKGRKQTASQPAF